MHVMLSTRDYKKRRYGRLAWGCAVLVCVVSPAGAGEPATDSATARLFARYCVQCHGTDGHGEQGRKTLPAIPDFTDASWHQTRTDIQLRISILEGKNQQMPSNRGQVTDAQAKNLVKYVRTFGSPPSAEQPSEQQPSAPPPSAKPASMQPASAPAASGRLADIASGDFAAQFAQLEREWGDWEKQLQALAPVTKAAGPVPVTKIAPSPKTGPAASAPKPPSASGAAKASSPPRWDPASERAPVWSAAHFFGQNCAGCHTIGAGSLTGPDLKNVTGRKDRYWLVQYLQNPKAVIDRGDPYALHLLAEARGVVMPKPFGMTRDRAESVLELIEAESRLEKSQFAGPPVSDAPFPPGDAERGRELFMGQTAFVNGGPACITCHTAHGLGQHEGGKLGPELTKAYERLGGRTSLTARLWSPATPTMLPVYKDHALELNEVMCLVAYLEEADKNGVEQSSAPPLKFLLLGLGGTVLGLATISFLWGSRGAAKTEAATGRTSLGSCPEGSGEPFYFPTPHSPLTTHQADLAGAP